MGDRQSVGGEGIRVWRMESTRRSAASVETLLGELLGGSSAPSTIRVARVGPTRLNSVWKKEVNRLALVSFSMRSSRPTSTP